MKYCATLIAALILAGQALDGAGPVEELSRNYPAFTVGTFTANLSYTLEPKHHSSTVKSWQVYTDLPKWKTVFRAATTVVEDGKPKVRSSHSETVVSDSVTCTASAHNVTKKALGIAVYVKPLTPAQTLAMRYDAFSFAFDGRIENNGLHNLPEILSLSKVTTRPEKLGRVDTVLVSATGKWGSHEVWLDPARGYLPLRVVQSKQPADLVNDEAVLGARAKDSRASPLVMLSKSVQQFDSTRLERFAGRWMVTAFTKREVLTYGDGSQEDYLDNVEVNTVSVGRPWIANPFRITLDAPDGTPVTAVDDEPIAYEWKGGKAVKAVNQAAVASAANQSFVQADAKSRWLPYAAAAAVASLACAVWAFVVARRKRS